VRRLPQRRWPKCWRRPAYHRHTGAGWGHDEWQRGPTQLCREGTTAGPSADPCGTPISTDCTADSWPPLSTLSLTTLYFNLPKSQMNRLQQIHMLTKCETVLVVYFWTHFSVKFHVLFVEISHTRGYLAWIDVNFFGWHIGFTSILFNLWLVAISVNTGTQYSLCHRHYWQQRVANLSGMTFC